MIGIKRIYEPAAPEDGYRVLVDRLWPRGVGRDAAHIDEWLKAIAPSTELRRWFDHDPERWPEFAARYRVELAAPDSAAHIARLRELARGGSVTLVFAARDEQHCNAVVIRDVLAGP